MADFLTAVKSVHLNTENEHPEPALKPLTSAKIRDNSGKAASPVSVGTEPDGLHTTIKTDSAEQALHILRSQPTVDQVIVLLKQLCRGAFDVTLDAPGPLQAQLITTILNVVIPNFWHLLKHTHSHDLVSCLRNVAGFNAIVARLRLLCSQESGQIQSISDLVDVAERVFAGHATLDTVWCGLEKAVAETRREMFWKECVNVVGSGKIIAAAAQAEDAVQTGEDSIKNTTWLARGVDYAAWLGANIATMVRNGGGHSTTTMFAKALSLGYSGRLLDSFFGLLIEEEVTSRNVLSSFISSLPAHTQRTVTEHTLHWLSSLTIATTEDVEMQDQEVESVAAFLQLFSVSPTVKQSILAFLSDPGLCSSLSFSSRRACVTTIDGSGGNDDLHQLLERMMTTFSDPIFISHGPVIQQECLAQMLLLVASRMHRKLPVALLMTARSSTHMQGMSNRLDSSNARARWLGMIVGTAFSSLVDKAETRMKFGTDDMETLEAKWYFDLVKVDDKVGTMNDFANFLRASRKAVRRPRRRPQTEAMPKINGKPVFGPPRPPVQTEIIGDRVTEILDDEGEDYSDGLKPYAKPDSDPEDSDEDAALVNRKKVRPPVYIRDLMSMLRDDKDHDRFQLGIKHAAGLVRRKANFGAEVRDHAEELASILCGLQDPFQTEDFDELRLQALIAVLLNDVPTMAPWLSRQAFTGDYSISQRCVMLSALGLGGRELAGYKTEDDLNPTLANTDFPSKRLPSHLHSIYGTSNNTKSTKRLEATSKSIEQTLIKPLALKAADQSTAHLNAVKIRTFSSRMDVERTKRKPAPNQLAKVFGEAFFFPLVNRYQQETASYGSASVYISVPFVLVTFIKTVALLLHASGPATLGLPQISGEFWDLLLSLRVAAIGDISVLQAVLFSLLTLLEVNTDKRRIAEEHPKHLVETQQWVDLVFERSGGGSLVEEKGDSDEVRVRTLAAGVLVRTKEVVDAYQKQLIGYTM